MHQVVAALLSNVPSLGAGGRGLVNEFAILLRNVFLQGLDLVAHVAGLVHEIPVLFLFAVIQGLAGFVQDQRALLHQVVHLFSEIHWVSSNHKNLSFSSSRRALSRQSL